MDYLEEIWEGPEVLDLTAGLRPKSDSTHTHTHTHTNSSKHTCIVDLWIDNIWQFICSNCTWLKSVRTWNRHHLYISLSVCFYHLCDTDCPKTKTVSEVTLHHMQSHQWAFMWGTWRLRGNWSVFTIWLSLLLILKLREASLVFSGISLRPVKTLLETVAWQAQDPLSALKPVSARMPFYSVDSFIYK